MGKPNKYGFHCYTAKEIKELTGEEVISLSEPNILNMVTFRRGRVDNENANFPSSLLGYFDDETESLIELTEQRMSMSTLKEFKTSLKEELIEKDLYYLLKHIVEVEDRETKIYICCVYESEDYVIEVDVVRESTYSCKDHVIAYKHEGGMSRRIK